MATGDEQFLAVLRCVQRFELKLFCERSRSVYRLKGEGEKKEVYPTQQGPDEDPQAFNLSLITGFELSVLCGKTDAERMGMLPGENVISQISFRTLWRGFRLYCWAKLCQEVKASMPSCTQIPRFFFPLLLYFTLNLGAQPFQITK